MRARRLVSLLAILTLAAALAACDGASGPTAEPSSSQPPEVAASASPGESATESVEPSLEPSLEPVESEEPTPDETEPSDEPAETDEPSAAADCTGTDDNRKFFSGVAESVDWTLYCPVLPAGWFVDAGEWRAAGGGRMEIAYKGPGGARLELHEGAFCAEGDTCVPDGSDAGTAAFGDREGTLIATDDGGWAVSVAADESFSYLAIGTGIGQDAFMSVTDAFIVVGG